ncbi:MAG: hypothetical protein DME20_01720 [Verrucomicrobia bacterium]|nr:MAG: hypothetical protein DME96_10555 [Verrucomicrobiota bacterium]PYK51443.1 MAG: hypothetical protein DME20_01720 [Verrucomicrobiota bacterium]
MGFALTPKRATQSRRANNWKISKSREFNKTQKYRPTLPLNDESAGQRAGVDRWLIRHWPPQEVSNE